MERPLRPPVIIVDYDPAWPHIFEAEKTRILEAIGPHILAIEHIGSTSVPGLAAKPIIDILIGLRSLGDSADVATRLEAIGYEYDPSHEDEFPERRHFGRGRTPAQVYHLHAVEVTTEFWKRHVLFRDYLRTHPEAAAEYGRLKKDLAARYGRDRDGYTDAKGPFIREIEERARDAYNTVT